MMREEMDVYYFTCSSGNEYLFSLRDRYLKKQKSIPQVGKYFNEDHMV